MFVFFFVFFFLFFVFLFFFSFCFLFSFFSLFYPNLSFKKNGETPLHLASRNGKEIASLLIEKGADINAKNNVCVFFCFFFFVFCFCFLFSYSSIQIFLSKSMGKHLFMVPQKKLPPF